eukprot:UN31334
MEANKKKKAKLIYLPDQNKFVKAEYVFFNVQEEIPPFVYKVPKMYVDFRSLFSIFGVTDKPDGQFYTGALDSFIDNHEGAILEFKHLKVLQNVLLSLLRNLNELDRQLLLRKKCMPNQNLILMAPSQLVVLDNVIALDEIVDMKLQTVYQEADFINIALKIGVPKLNSLLHYELSSKQNCTINCQNLETKQQGLLRSIEFRQGIMRLVNHERSCDNESMEITTDKTILPLINSFGECMIKIVDEINVKITVRHKRQRQKRSIET